jgi:hypothetical protein
MTKSAGAPSKGNACKPVNALVHAHLHAQAHTRTLNARTQWVLSYSGAPHAVGTTRYSEAIADFSAVIRLDPSNANAYFNRGSVRLCAPLPCASAPGPRLRQPYLRRDCAHPCPHLRRDWGSPVPTSAPRLGLTPATSAPRLGLTPATSAPGLGAALEPVGTASTRSSRRRTGARLARARRARDLRLHHGARPRHGRLGQALERAALGRRRFPCRGHLHRRDGASRDRQRVGGAGIAHTGCRVASDLAPSQRRARSLSW